MIVITLSACGAKKAPEMEPQTEAIGTLTETEPSFEVDPSMHQHVESVRVYIDGYICTACIGPMKRYLQEEENVKFVAERPEVSMIEIVPLCTPQIRKTTKPETEFHISADWVMDYPSTLPADLRYKSI